MHSWTLGIPPVRLRREAERANGTIITNDNSSWLNHGFVLSVRYAAQPPRAGLGKCAECGNWDTYVEEIEAGPVPAKARGARSQSTSVQAVALADVTVSEEPRILTGIGELDRVLGGGIMAGSIVLVGGDPGVGKSTLMAQMCGGLAGRRILYVTGEESLRQIKLRADRLGVINPGLLLLAETNLDS